MNCQWVKDNLSAYLDGEMSHNDVVSLKKHVEGCNSCGYEYRRISRAWEMLDLWEDKEPPAYMKKAISLKIEKEKTLYWLRFLLPAAAVLLLAISALLFYTETNRNDGKDMIAKSEEPVLNIKKDIQEVNEEEIISNLQLFQEKEFLDSFDTLKKIDYLPLVEEIRENNIKDKRSLLEFLAA
ncbi:MAG: zf-HC2 domain-containing protein [Nitrospirota bacterium]